MDASSTTTMVSDPATDPVESLRAAALSTLKAKRRKPPPEKPAAPIPSRPPPPSDSFQLDYGFGEDNIPDVLMADSVLPNPPPSEKVAKAPVADEEGQSREEGEISEEEEPPPLFKQPTAPPIRKPSRSPKPVKTATTPEPEKVAEKKLSTPTPEPAPSYKPPTTEVQPPLAPAPTLMERISEPVPYMSVLEQEQEPSDFPMELISEPELNPSFSLLDSDHVRPGLSLTQDEYDTVKDIILDLLGWGVPFDHLVESGLSREILHYVFTELNLRLPDTFDTSGIIPYTPETFGQLQQSVLMPPPPIPEKRRTSVDSETLPAVDTSTRSTTPPSTTTSIPTSDSPFGSDLHDMERLRRQELMARKAAVQASRKLKHSTSAESSTDSSHVLSPDKEDVIKGPVVPTEAVEDFLKSIGSVQVLEAPAAVVAPPPEPKQPSNEMDVDRTPEDEQIVERDARKGDPSQYNALDYSFAEPPPSSAEPPPSSSEAPPTSVGSTTTTFSQSSDQTLVTPSSDQIITPQRVAPRRGTKRPVASDFVDFDPAPRRHDSTSRIERSNGPVHASGITRRLTTGTSFHNIGGSRRCVIDLSDSEDDGEGYPQALQPSFEDQVWLRRDNNKRGRISKYPSPAPLRPTSSSSNNMSPAALAQKELEIRKMRELIAQREEETRLKKLAMARSNPETRPPSTTQNHSASLKQEEVDVVMSSVTEESSNDSLVTKNGRHSESATPPPSNGDSRFSPPGFSKGINESPESPTADGTDSAGANQLDRKSVQDQDVACEAQKAQVRSGQDFLQEQGEQKLPLQRTALAEGPVDADPSPSPSTQVSSTLPALPKQDAKRLDLSDITSSTNELQAQADADSFAAYHSPFESYPRLRDYPRRKLSDQFSPSHDLSSLSSPHMYTPTQSSLSSDSYSVYAKPSISPYSFSSSSASISLPDLKPLKLAASVKLLDPFKRLCQYEIPGGGMCRDDGCEDVHLSRLEGTNQMGLVEPSDEDTAEYLFNIMPNSWLAQHQITSSSKIFSALQQVYHRTLNSPLGFEDRVAQALLSIGPPATT